jgi:hypothetical protein
VNVGNHSFNNDFLAGVLAVSAGLMVSIARTMGATEKRTEGIRMKIGFTGSGDHLRDRLNWQSL